MSLDFHPLLFKCVLWGHLPHEIDWSIKSYNNIITVRYVEELITLLHVLPDQLITNCMTFFMEDGILPMWEDPSNRQGGCFSYKIPNKHVCGVWKNLCYALAGGTLTQDKKFNSSVNGITISPKKSFCIVKIWMKSCDHQDPSKIIPIPNLTQTGCLFKKHQPEF